MMFIAKVPAECPCCGAKAIIYKATAAQLGTTQILVLCWECWRALVIAVLRADAPGQPHVVAESSAAASKKERAR